MACSFLVIAAALLLSPSAGGSADMTPLTKVVQMLQQLQQEIMAEGEAEQKAYTQFSEFCETRSRELHFDIKTADTEIEELTAVVVEEDALAKELNAKIEELAGTIGQDEGDLKDATLVRNKDHADFEAEETELTQVISMIKRATGILERELAKTDSSFLQENSKSLGDVSQALKALVDASMLSSADAVRLTAFVQSSDDSDDDDQAVNAPASKVYDAKSGGIIETLHDLLEKAEGQLNTARKEESNEAQNFNMLKQSLSDAIDVANKAMKNAKKDLKASNERSATAASDKREAKKTRAEDQKALDQLHNECLTRANEFQATTKSRVEEATAVIAAIKIIKDTTSGANEIAYGLTQESSFLQLTRTQITNKAELSSFEAVRLVRDLASKEHSAALAQLATRMTQAIRVGGRSEDDVFTKVKGLISDLIVRLTAEGEADAEHEAWCRREISESDEKEEDKTAEIAKLTASIDKMSARSAKLKTQTAELQKQLAELAASQSEMDKMRAEENAIYVKTESELTEGLNGVKKALSVLSNYYAQKADHKTGGAGAGIVGFLETIESDLTKDLGETNEEEESALAAYKQQTDENEVDKATKVQAVRYKSQEFIQLDKSVSEATSDRSGVQDELDAVMAYLKELHGQCDEVAEPYAVRKEKREREIAGLKDALNVLRDEGVDMDKIDGPVAVSLIQRS